MPFHHNHKFRVDRAIAIILVILCILYLFSLWHTKADIDDAWIGEHAYWLATTGHVKSELMRGITLQEDYLIVHHKLLVLNGALFIKAFGFSVYSLKSVSLVYFIIFLMLFTYYSMGLKKIPGKDQLIFCFLLIISFPWVFKYSYVFRPEMMLMVMAFASWILLEGIIENRKKVLWYALAAGILGGLSFSTHLNGFIIAVAGFLLLIIHKKIGPAVVFSVGVLLGAAVYFYDFNSSHGWHFWWMQFSESPALDSLSGVNPILQPFLNLVNEHMRFFHNPVIASYSVLAIISLTFGYRLLLKKRKTMLWYTLLLALLLGLSAMHKSRQYLLVYFPFIAIMISDVIHALFSKQDSQAFFVKWRSHPSIPIILWVSLAAFLIISNYTNIVYSLQKFSPSENEAITKKYITEDPSEINIVAPMTFIFNEIEKFGRIQSDVCYAELQKSDPSITGAGFLERTKSFDIRYIILSPYWKERLGMDHPDQIRIPDDFKILSGPNEENLVIAWTGAK